MYLSKLIFNVNNYRVRRDLNDVVQMHKTILSAFPHVPEKQKRSIQGGIRAHFGVLYRVNVHKNHSYSAIIQSRVKPNFASVDNGYCVGTPQVKTIDFIFSAIVKGGQFRFKLFANPTMRIHEEGRKNNPKVPLKKKDSQMEWLHSKGEHHGFSVENALITREMELYGYKKRPNQKRSRRLTFYGVGFEGILTVNDAESFKETIRQGIGSGKAFGFGLLSLRR